MSVSRMLCGLVLCLFLLAPSAWADDAGKVVRLQGRAEAREDNAARPLAVGDPIRSGDVLRTGSGSRLLIQFTDGMELTLSDGAEMADQQA